MRKQTGIALSGLLFWAIVIALVAVLGIKVAPDYIDFYKAQKSISLLAADSRGKSVAEIRAAFNKYADVNQLRDISGNDLDISTDGNRATISFAYEKRIPLFYNVSLLIDFQGSSEGR